MAADDRRRPKRRPNLKGERRAIRSPLTRSELNCMKVNKMKLRSILAAVVLSGMCGQAYAKLPWTYETDDGRKVTSIQVSRDMAACDTMLAGRYVVPDSRSALTTCMRAKGYIIHS